nr:hypothetical protein CFP56_60745 [Quercus suber]
MVFAIRDILPRNIWRAWTTQADQHHQASSVLHKIPPELLLSVLDHLSLADIASLALCDKALRDSVGPSAWNTLKPGNGHDEARRCFLHTLTRDDGRYFFCHRCLSLHNKIRVQLPVAMYGSARPLPCHTLLSRVDMNDDCFQTHNSLWIYSLWFPHVQLAMARHLFGRDHGIDLDALAVTEVACIPGGDFSTLLSVDPGIVDGELCMRVQQWMCFPSNNHSCLFEHRRWSICTHLESSNILFVPKLLRCKLHHADSQQACPMCYPLLSCKLCNVQFSVKLRALEDGRTTAVVVSKWINFGSGETRDDPKWRLKTHKYFAELWLPITRADEVGGLCSRFERQHLTSVADQTAANASLLDRGRYQEEGFTPVGSYRIWVRTGRLPRK